MWIQIHIGIDFTKLGANAFIMSFLRLRCGAHLIHQPTADSVVQPLREDLIAFVCIPRCYDKEYKDSNTSQILFKKIQKQKQKTSEIACV